MEAKASQIYNLQLCIASDASLNLNVPTGFRVFKSINFSNFYGFGMSTEN